MIDRRMAIPVIAASLLFAACGQDPPPEQPQPTGPTAEEIAQARQDSIDAARQARQDSIAEARAAATAEAAEIERRTRAAREILQEMVYFDYDEAAITPEAERVLRQKIDILRGSPAVHLRVEGHTDERGSTEYNIALGNRRAESVREFLVGFGLDPNRFSIVSYGESRPLVDGQTESAWARNRRAEFLITQGADQINPIGE